MARIIHNTKGQAVDVMNIVYWILIFLGASFAVYFLTKKLFNAG